MFTFKICVLFSSLFILLLAVENGLTESLCSNKKAEGKCFCKRLTDDELYLPVKKADCARIGLEQFPAIDKDVNSLDLSRNRIKLATIQENFDSLLILNLAFNDLATITADNFQATPNLRKLDLSHNQISTLDKQVFAPLGNLVYLDLSYNKFQLVTEGLLGPLIGLKFLDLSYNNKELGKCLVQTPDTLQNYLHLTRNISVLKLESLGIEQLPNTFFDDYNNLKLLDLADNTFDKIPNIPYSVEILDLSGTSIATLQTKYLNYHSLRVLKLDRLQKLNSIHRYAFYNLQSLEELSITNCPNLEEFNDEVFGVLIKDIELPIKRLFLSRNRLKTLNSTFRWLFDQMELVDLSGNSWSCQCELMWLKDYTKLLKNNLSIKCGSPSSIRGRQIWDLGEEDLQNCYPEKYGKRLHRFLLPTLLLLIIILCALIAYLIFYGPNWADVGGVRRGMGPQSPYNPTRQEDED